MKEWRAQYAELSENIREQKLNRKDKDALIRASAFGPALLELRKKSKVEAQQYLAAKAALVAAVKLPLTSMYE